MAELHNEISNSVSGDVYEKDLDLELSSNLDANRSSFIEDGGSQRSEVNKSRTMDIMSVSNISNNFQNSNMSSDLASVETLTNSKTLECRESIIDETGRQNQKNKQLAQGNSSTTTKDKDEDKNTEVSVETQPNMQSNGSSLSDENNHKQGKKRRGISFPKDTFISSYFEPPDPWKNALHWTTDDLIAAYKKSCEIHGTKPVVKILQQLHAVSTPGKREESFILKGEKLDHKQVECIEEILRRVQFQLVDLEGSHLDDECAVALFDMIEYYESACQLNISSNRNIGARGWQACSRLVRRTPTLNYLDMRNCDLNERTIPIFGRALKMGCHLTILHMENMSLSGRPLIILVAALKMNETLQELFLAENRLMPTDGVQLGNLMRYNHKLNLLDLRKNLLQDVGVSHLCDGLIEQDSDPGLRTLVLWNNQMTYQAMPSLGRVLGASHNIETLNIGHNNITNEGVHLLKDGLLKTTSLLRIGLQGTGVSDEGAVALAEFIADSTMLLRIDLRDNEIKTGGLMALSHAMRVNSSVTRIDLDKDTKKESVIKDYAEQQSRLLRDILTFQQRNIQVAAEREEQERAQLEKLALEAAAAREKKQLEHAEENETVSIEESAASIEENEADKVQPKQQVETDLPQDDQPVKEEAVSTTSTSSPIPPVTVSEEQHASTHQRPKLLFTHKELQPQESLDSPQPAPNNFDQHPESSPSEGATPIKSMPHPNLPLAMPDGKLLCTNTPAEMLLSPQYYPKQLARKIFSVTHVNEDVCSSSDLPSSDSDMCHSDFDPLNVCQVPHVSSSTSRLLPAFPKPDSTVLGPSSASLDCGKVNDSILSPTTLVRDMADETVNQIVNMNEDHVSEDSTTAPKQTSLSSENTNISEILLQPQDHNILTSSTELGCDYEMPSCKSDEMLRPVEATCDSIHGDENNSETIQVSSLSSENEMKSPKDSSQSEMSDPSSMMSKDKTESVVPSVTNGEVKLNEKSCASMDVGKKTGISVSDASPPKSSQSANEGANQEEPASDFYSADRKDSQSQSDSLLSELNLTRAHSAKEHSSLQSQGKDNSNDTSNEAISKSESQSSFAEIEAVQPEEEEPWTAVDGEDSKGESGNQPDFFTTLSMNGLTQELASALTSLDGSAREDNAGLKSPDEFERELDAMLADVKQDSPVK